MPTAPLVQRVLTHHSALQLAVRAPQEPFRQVVLTGALPALQIPTRRMALAAPPVTCRSLSRHLVQRPHPSARWPLALRTRFACKMIPAALARRGQYRCPNLPAPLVRQENLRPGVRKALNACRAPPALTVT